MNPHTDSYIKWGSIHTDRSGAASTERHTLKLGTRSLRRGERCGLRKRTSVIQPSVTVNMHCRGHSFAMSRPTVRKTVTVGFLGDRVNILSVLDATASEAACVSDELPRSSSRLIR